MQSDLALHISPYTRVKWISTSRSCLVLCCLDSIGRNIMAGVDVFDDSASACKCTLQPGGGVGTSSSQDQRWIRRSCRDDQAAKHQSIARSPCGTLLLQCYFDGNMHSLRYKFTLCQFVWMMKKNAIRHNKYQHLHLLPGIHRVTFVREGRPTESGQSLQEASLQQLWRVGPNTQIILQKAMGFTTSWWSMQNFPTNPVNPPKNSSTGHVNFTDVQLIFKGTWASTSTCWSIKCFKNFHLFYSIFISRLKIPRSFHPSFRESRLKPSIARAMADA